MTPADAVALAQSWDGISAEPDSLAQYLEIIALIEPQAAATQMAKMSGCGLVVRGYLRCVLSVLPSELTDLYVDGHALSDLDMIAKRAAADMPPSYEPEPGDVEHVGAGRLAPEHVTIITAISQDGLSLSSIQGGMRTPKGAELVGSCERTLLRGRDAASDREANGVTRPVLGWYSLARMLTFYV